MMPASSKIKLPTIAKMIFGFVSDSDISPPEMGGNIYVSGKILPLIIPQKYTNGKNLVLGGHASGFQF
jgi:hypothetical protein